MGFPWVLWKINIQKVHLPKISIPGQIVFEILAQLCPDDAIITLRTESNLEGFVWGLEAKWNKYLRDSLPHNTSFWQVGLSDVVLSKYPNKFHKLFENLIFMMSSLKNSITLPYALWELTQEKKLLL